jgi:hypothetical protein
MAHRKLIDGKVAWELKAPIDLIIHTKAPGKWKLIDMETGQEYIGAAEPNKYGCWIRIKDIDGKD